MPNLREPGRMSALQAMVGVSKADAAAILAEVRMPTLIVMGTKDPHFSGAAAEATSLAAPLRAD